ncbi:uncharacterized protein LOC134228154 [Armigeres subalbatus]|uniref:uncharacterized protein LOC134228154 n=1 Tax=Armigeres subalbatus TaxID=124917 RepID=UPI002ED4C3BE
MDEDHLSGPLSPHGTTQNFDNGASGTRTSSPHRKPKAKVTKKKLLEELSALKSEMANMRSEKEQNLLSGKRPTESSAVNVRPDEGPSGSDSFLATMSNMSLGSLNIPECKPSEGEMDVDKKAYEHWKEILIASFNLMRATDERAKLDIFRIKAGPKLLEVMQGTSSIPGMPDECVKPFSNAIARLDHYFGSRTYIIGQRGKLMNTVQQSGESNISFVRRVAAAAKLCDYKNEEEMEAVVRTIVKRTTDSRVRVLAHRNWVNQGDMNSLIGLVRDSSSKILLCLHIFCSNDDWYVIVKWSFLTKQSIKNSTINAT